MKFSLRQVGPDFQLAPNFKLIEMACKDGSDKVLVHPALLLLLQHLRDHFDQPTTINSGYRTKSHNAFVNGRPKSLHLSGMAADIDVFGVAPGVVADYCENLGVGGLGRYNTFTHVDVWKKNRRWDKRA